LLAGHISFGWGDATVSLRTENDFIMAAKIDRIASTRSK
jgi:pterin-4a-carbinolamine dehydratase